MTDLQLDELLTIRWPIVVRRVMADDQSQEWARGFVRSIAKQSKRKAWRPTKKQLAVMERFVVEILPTTESEIEVIER